MNKQKRALNLLSSPKIRRLTTRSICRGWRILQELIFAIRDHNESNRIKSLPTMLLAVAHATNTRLTEDRLFVQSLALS